MQPELPHDKIYSELDRRITCSHVMSSNMTDKTAKIIEKNIVCHPRFVPFVWNAESLPKSYRAINLCAEFPI